MVNKEAKESGGESRRESRPESGETAATDERTGRGFSVCVRRGEGAGMGERGNRRRLKR